MSTPAPVPPDGTVVVVGAGLAGHSAATALRARGHVGPLVLIGAETHLPYDRPPLSKAVLLGEVEDTALPALPADVEVRTGVCATGLERGVLHTDAGEVAFDGLVLATGAEPRRLPGAGEQLTLRTREDALALRARLAPGQHVVVVGAGWIGAEVTTAALARGARVTVVEAAAAPFALPLGAEVGARTTGWFTAAGATLLLDAAVHEVDAAGVLLADGTHLAADTVVVGIGARPTLDWLDGSPLVRSGELTLDHGVVVDAHLASGVPGVVAVGDAAAWWSRRFGTRMRIEHWDDALHAGTVAAATLLAPAEGVVHDPVPYFWSEQLGRRVQFAGHREGADTLVHRGELATGPAAVFWLAGDVLTAVLTVDRPRDLLQGRRAVGQRMDLGSLADQDLAVRDAVIPS